MEDIPISGGVVEGVVLEDTAEPSEAGLESLEDKIYRMEAQIGSIQNNLETIIPIIRGLSAKIPRAHIGKNVEVIPWALGCPHKRSRRTRRSWTCTPS